MISYAQNGEDVVLARLLGPGPGFYVDCGAADPHRASVTRYFYDLGWTGINIEPREQAARALTTARPHDVTLCAAVGDRDGEVVLTVREDDPDQSFVSDDATDGVTVPMRSLDSILAEHSPARIDFLKIDVEGHEKAVLEGIDLTRWRPKVIVIEAIKPWSTERTDAEWRHLITGRGYDEALFDGINLYFVAEESGIQTPVPPASALDRYEPHRFAVLQQRVAAQEARINALTGSPGPVDEAHVSALQAALLSIEEELGRRDAVLQDPPAVPVVEPSPALGPRFLVLGSGGDAERLRDVLAKALGVDPLVVAHPGDVDWSALPERCVLQLDWRPTRLLTGLVRQQGIRPVVVDGSTDWAGLPGTTSVRSEDLEAGAAALVEGL